MSFITEVSQGRDPMQTELLLPHRVTGTLSRAVEIHGSWVLWGHEGWDSQGNLLLSLASWDFWMSEEQLYVPCVGSAVCLFLHLISTRSSLRKLRKPKIVKVMEISFFFSPLWAVGHAELFIFLPSLYKILIQAVSWNWGTSRPEGTMSLPEQNLCFCVWEKSI